SVSREAHRPFTEWADSCPSDAWLKDCFLARIIHERLYCNRDSPLRHAWPHVSQRPRGRVRRSVGQHPVKETSLPRGLGSGASLAHSYKGAGPPCRIPTKRAHPLRNSQAECYHASRLRAHVALGDSTFS